MPKDIERTLITGQQIARRVAELAEQIARTYEGMDQNRLTLVPILSGSMIFAADLIRQLPMKMKIGLMAVSSYPGMSVTSRGPKLRQQLDVNVAGRHVLVVDDILDTGQTLGLVLEELGARKPASLRTCVLLRKAGRAPQGFVPDFVGFDIEDVFVVGYGLDYNDRYRSEPDIGVLRAGIWRPRQAACTTS